MPIPNEIIQQLCDTVDEKAHLQDVAETAMYTHDIRGLFSGHTPLVLCPSTTEQVAAIVKICAEAGIGIVPQGGNTGYMGGSIPSEANDEIVVSLARLNKIRAIDKENYTITVEAGCILENIQQQALDTNRLFPLSLAAEGSCQIGGNLSTNAGGIAVLRYGNTRDLVLGLEVVLANGEIWHGLRGLRKDNTGYDLKQLFIGAEGTLGIITAAVLKLFPLPQNEQTALIAVDSPASAIWLLSKLRAASSDSINSFEYIQRPCIELVLEHIENTRDPFDESYQHYILVQLASGQAEEHLREILTRVLNDAIEQNHVLDAVIAETLQHTQDLWRFRELIPEAQKRAGACIKHDIAVPVASLPNFLTAATALVSAKLPHSRLTVFGHFGDGNLHFNISQGEQESPDSFLSHSAAVTQSIHDLVIQYHGSFSAEHGIGQAKVAAMYRYKSKLELTMMRQIKQTLDPENIMNPRKILGDISP